MTKEELLAQTMVCPHCRHGVTGTDHTGEAMECGDCDGNGLITIAFVEDQVRARHEQAGDLYVAHHLLREVYERWKRLPPDLREQIKSFIEPVPVLVKIEPTQEFCDQLSGIFNTR